MCIVKEKVGTEIKIQTKDRCEHYWLARVSDLEKNYQLLVEVVGKVYKLCQEGFGQEDTPAFHTDVEKHIRGEEKICLIPEDQCKRLSYAELKTNRIKAFAAYRIMRIGGEKILYLSGIVIAPEMQGRHVASALIKSLMEREGVTKVAARTQNPVMHKSLCNACQKVFPRLVRSEVIPSKIADMGEKVARLLSMRNYEKKRMTEKATYGGCSLYGTQPELKNQNKNAIFAERVVKTRGDSMIIIGVIDKKQPSLPLFRKQSV